MAYKHKGRPPVMLGEIGVLAAMFDQAWADVRLGNRYAEDARAFLEDERTVEALVGIGLVDGDYYRWIVRAPERDRNAEMAERVRWMYEMEDLPWSYISEEIFGRPSPGSNRYQWMHEVIEGGAL